MKNLIKIIFVLSVLNQVQTPNYCQSNKLFEIIPYADIKYFYWGEYNDYSLQNLEEYGFLYGGGLNGKTMFSNSFNLYSITDFNFYYGIVNYNGFLQDALGNFESYKSETVYLGLEALLNIGYDFKLGRYFTFSPELGLEYEYWNRDIDNGGEYGYNELWNLLLFDFGCYFIVPLPPSSKIFLKLIGEYPLIINESIDLASRGHTGQANVNLKPGSNYGINMELGAVIYRAFISFYLDYSLYSKSAFDQNYHQPESDRSLTGLKLGYSF